VLVTFYGGAKVLLSPTATEMFHRHNANTVVGMSLISISFAALGTSPTPAAPCIVAGCNLLQKKIAGPSMMLGLRDANLKQGASSMLPIILFATVPFTILLCLNT
jgi:hypothetical protein